MCYNISSIPSGSQILSFQVENRFPSLEMVRSAKEVYQALNGTDITFSQRSFGMSLEMTIQEMLCYRNEKKTVNESIFYVFCLILKCTTDLSNEQLAKFAELHGFSFDLDHIPFVFNKASYEMIRSSYMVYHALSKVNPLLRTLFSPHCILLTLSSMVNFRDQGARVAKGEFFGFCLRLERTTNLCAEIVDEFAHFHGYVLIRDCGKIAYIELALRQESDALDQSLSLSYFKV